MRRWVVVLAGLILLAASGALVARADEPVVDREAFVVKTRLGPFAPMKAEVEEVYITQTLWAIQRLGLRMEPNYNHVDWLFGREYTFRPWDWDSNVWRLYAHRPAQRSLDVSMQAWAETPGQRFAKWWVGYCIASNCTTCDGEGCAGIRDELGAKFDLALSAITAR